MEGLAYRRADENPGIRQNLVHSLRFTKPIDQARHFKGWARCGIAVATPASNPGFGGSAPFAHGHEPIVRGTAQPVPETARAFAFYPNGRQR